ncbi:30S ribosomal protein S9 [Candidatus Cyrtobacter comes]|uniref:Small ribosomal subunit protein uS9 n=1 Tax=Candidatus Cyrtobacter comes TaxID=675776 RepID=A0ABU5L819_9RICK|nr:30S ribosomal protein S9 [Candidatus Cyrtobacter comes]MDZ5762269.1 30S ribosomal protein S9 [Candidatus Cyrtobacter comes]
MDSRSYGTGRRKEASARVWISSGSGKVVVNNKSAEIYFGRECLLHLVKQPLIATNTIDQFDVFCTVRGSGKPSQAGAVRHGISRALNEASGSFRAVLKANGFLTRDSRAVERKKYGRKKARKSFQFSKR